MKKILFAIILFFISSTFAQKKTDNFLPVSVWYSGGIARAPMLSEITDKSKEEWRQDIEQIKSLGFNTVRTWVEWAHCEPKEGEYNFQNLDLLMNLAEEQGLKVIIQMYVDSAPDWVGKKYPEAQFEAQNGDKIPSQAAPGFCTDNPGVRKAVLNFYTETAKVASKHSNLFGWDLWSEPHIVNWAGINYIPNVQFCYCPFTKERFRNWLMTKYKSLDAINKAWYRNFEKIEDVDPPRYSTILSYTDFIDWKNFLYEKMAEDLKMRYDAVKSGDAEHVITSHAAIPSIFNSPYNGYGPTDDFMMSKQVDYYGTSLYPKHNNPKTHWKNWLFMAAVDFTRSANKKNGGFYVGELQAGKGTIALNIGDPITPQDHKIWMWSAIAKGAKAINIYAYYPMSSGYESDGYGLINLDGTVTERAISAGKTAKIINDNKDIILNSHEVQAQVALVYNPLSQMVGGEQRRENLDAHQNSLFGYYSYFADNNIPVDFIHRMDIENGDLKNYKLIILPYSLMLTEKAAEGIKKYVEAGGTVVSEARLAWNDERGYASNVIPGMGLSEVFGAKETNIKMSDSVKMMINSSTDQLSEGLNGLTLKGAFFAETLEPLKKDNNTKVLASFDDNSPCIVESHYGKGKTLLLGSFMGLANHPVPDANNDKFLSNVVNWAGIERRYSSSADGASDTPVEIRLREYDGGYLLFMINHAKEKRNLHVKVKTSSDSKYNLTELTENKALNLTAKDNTLNIITDINSQDVLVWNIKKE